jgi:hypothetical protein
MAVFHRAGGLRHRTEGRPDVQVSCFRFMEELRSRSCSDGRSGLLAVGDALGDRSVGPRGADADDPDATAISGGLTQMGNASTQTSPSPEKTMAPQLAAALSAATLAFRDMAVGLGARLLEIGDDPARAAISDLPLPRWNTPARAASIVYGNRRRCLIRFVRHCRKKLGRRFIRPRDRSRFRRRSLIRLNGCGGFCWRRSRANRRRVCWRSIRIRRLVGLWSGAAFRHLASLNGCGCLGRGRNFGRGLVQLNRPFWGPWPRQWWG